MPKRSSKVQQELALGDDRPFPPGFHYLPGYLDATGQTALLADLGTVLQQAPLFEQTMPRTGTPLSVRMTNAGDYGWVTDRDGGYRYQGTHPVTGRKWPAIPARLMKLWTDLTAETKPPNLCLINFYGQDARLGLHQDRGDSSLEAPVVSISLGDDATFILGGLSRKDALRRVRLRSGDIMWFGGASRLIFHGVEGVISNTSALLQKIGLPGGRINLTLRRIDSHERVA